MLLATDVDCDGGLASQFAGADGVGLVLGLPVYVLVYTASGAGLLHGVDEGGAGRCRLTCSFGRLGDPVVLCPLSLLGDLRPSGDILGP